MRLLAPSTLLVLCWSLTGLFAALALSRIDQFDLVTLFMNRESLHSDAFTLIGATWIGTALLVYLTADLAAQTALPRRRPDRTQRLDRARAARITFWLNLGLLGVTALWILSAAAKLGGLVVLAGLAYVDSLGARDLLLDNKLFTGMRLFYAALPATGCLAAALLAGKTPLPRDARAMCRATLILNTIALFILPIVMSQRLLLLQFLLSAYLVSCLVRGRLFGLGRVALGLGLFLATWMLRESLTNPLIDRSALDIGSQKLAFYFVNDMWNGFAPIQGDIPHTLGGVSLRGFMFLTFTDGVFAQALAPRMHALDAVLGGGEFPFLTAAYVDFGALLGTAFIAACAFVFRLVFHKARRSLIWAAVYAQIGGALLFSTHSIYFTHQNFLFSLLLIAFVARLSRTAPRPVARPPLPDIPDTIARHMLPFQSCRRAPRRGRSAPRYKVLTNA